jgi:hypothetical protein
VRSASLIHSTLNDLEFRIDILLSIEELAQEGIALVRMEITCPHCCRTYEEVIEVPMELASELRPLAGRMTNISKLNGKHYTTEVNYL